MSLKNLSNEKRFGFLLLGNGLLHSNDIIVVDAGWNIPFIFPQPTFEQLKVTQEVVLLEIYKLHDWDQYIASFSPEKNTLV